MYNILQLITGLGVGGAEKVVLDLTSNIDKKKYSCYVVGMSQRDEFLEQFKANGITVKILNRNNKIKDFFCLVKEVNQFVKENKIKLIHAHLAHAVIIASIVKILQPNIKVVFTSHSLNIGSRIVEFIIWMLKPFRNIDILLSKDLLKYFYKSKYKVIPNGIDIKQYNLKVKRNDRFTFISVGRLETVKNHRCLIKLVNNLKDLYDFELHIVGEGYLRKEYENLISEYSLGSRVKLLGLRDNVPQLLNSSHCLLMPSLWEGLPIVILEAGASGLPVISTSVGSIPSILNSDNSYLSEIDGFEDRMKEVLMNYNNAKEKASILQETISNNYSIESVVKEHEIIYETLIER